MRIIPWLFQPAAWGRKAIESFGKALQRGEAADSSSGWQLAPAETGEAGRIQIGHQDLLLQTIS